MAQGLLLNVKGLNTELSFVDNYIGEFLCVNHDAGAVAQVFSTVRNSRGKMLRPLLLLLAARFGPQYKDKHQRLCKLAALVEIVHMASLIHDDIVDDSPLRRGYPTAQQKFGKDMAVFAGDFMISRVMYHLSKEYMTQAGLIISRAIEKMCCGELGQAACCWDTETTINTHLLNIYNKSAALFVAAIQLGAIESGCGECHINCLTAIGEHLGYMFQMRDDLLDFVCDQQKAGKPVHQDFADGIYTLPVLYALAQPKYAARLREIAGISNNSPNYAELLQEMRELVAHSGGLAFSWAQIENHAAQAQRHLKTLPAQEASSGIYRLISQLLDNSDLCLSALSQSV